MAVRGAAVAPAEGDGVPPKRRNVLERFKIALVAPAIYGLVVSSGVMASAGPEVPLIGVALAVLVTVFVYWVAEQYAGILGARLAGRATTPGQVRSSLREGWPMVEASYAPLLVLLIAWLFGASRTVAILIALSFTTALLFGFGWVAGRRSGLSGAGLLASVLVAGALGLVMIVLKVALH
jgi:hypothetical protein